MDNAYKLTVIRHEIDRAAAALYRAVLLLDDLLHEEVEADDADQD